MTDNGEYKGKKGPTITVTLEPSGTVLILPRVKTVRQLFTRMAIQPGTTLVIRDGGLLTPDREILPEDAITLRSVVSRG